MIDLELKLVKKKKKKEMMMVIVTGVIEGS